MKHLYILFGFIPWILFGLLAGPSLLLLKTAIIVSFCASIIIGYQELKRGGVLAWGTALFFTFILISIVFLENIWIMQHIGLLINIMLVTIAGGSLLIGKPFTEQIAKRNVAQEIAQRPAFKIKNRWITGLWTAIFVINLLLSIFLPLEGYLWNLSKMLLTIFVGFGLTILIIEKLRV